MLILFFITSLFLTIATIQDIKSGEIENWVSVCLVISILTLKLILSWTLFFHSLISLGIFFILGWGFYLGKLFEAGDAKLLMALGVTIPLSDLIHFLLWFSSIAILYFICVRRLCV